MKLNTKNLKEKIQEICFEPIIFTLYPISEEAASLFSKK